MKGFMSEVLHLVLAGIALLIIIMIGVKLYGIFLSDGIHPATEQNFDRFVSYVEDMTESNNNYDSRQMPFYFQDDYALVAADRYAMSTLSDNREVLDVSYYDLRCNGNSCACIVKGKNAVVKCHIFKEPIIFFGEDIPRTKHNHIGILGNKRSKDSVDFTNGYDITGLNYLLFKRFNNHKVTNLFIEKINLDFNNPRPYIYAVMINDDPSLNLRALGQSTIKSRSEQRKQQVERSEFEAKKTSCNINNQKDENEQDIDCGGSGNTCPQCVCVIESDKEFRYYDSTNFDIPFVRYIYYGPSYGWRYTTQSTTPNKVPDSVTQRPLKTDTGVVIEGGFYYEITEAIQNKGLEEGFQEFNDLCNGLTITHKK